MHNLRFETTAARFFLMVALAFGILAASPLFAAGDGPWSVTLKAGQASVAENFHPNSYGWRADDEDTSAGLAVTYSPSRFFGFEAAYHDLGTYPGLPVYCEVCTAFEILVIAHPAEVEFSGFSLAVLPTWPLTDNLAIFGKLGVFDWQGDVTRFFPRQRVDDPSGTDLLTGIGARFTSPSGLGVQIEYETTELHENLSLGASWTF